MPALVIPAPGDDWPMTPANVVKLVLVTVRVRVAMRVAGPLNVRSLLPPKVELPLRVTALATVIGPPSARMVPPGRLSVPVPAALAPLSPSVPALTIRPPENVLIPDSTRTPVPLLVSEYAPPLCPMAPL